MIVCSVEPHAEQRSGNRISGHVVVPGGNQPGQVKLDYVVAAVLILSGRIAPSTCDALF
jgi:hypothetical protein